MREISGGMGLAIRKARTRLEMTQAELAQRVGVSKNCVWLWEHGYRSPDAGRLWRLANALALNVSELTAHKIVEEK